MEHNLPRFFVSPSQIQEKYIFLLKEQYHKVINVLRLNVNDNLIILDNLNNEYLCVISEIKKNKIICNILAKNSFNEPNFKIIIAQSLIKKTGMEILVQKATELGVQEIYPIVTKHSVVKNINLNRLNLIAQEASSQSERKNLPTIHKIQKLEDFLNNLPCVDVLLLCLEREELINQELFYRIPLAKSIMILCGPEGGFSKSEVELILSKNFIPISLGKNILRAETSAIAAIAIFSYIHNNLKNLK